MENFEDTILTLMQWETLGSPVTPVLCVLFGCVVLYKRVFT